MERRSTTSPAGITVETRTNGRRVIVGYAAVFFRGRDPGTEYALGPGIVERIAPVAFDKALSRPDDVRALFNHDADHLLGRTKAGTVRLRTDATGLRYEIDIPDTQLGRDVAQSIRRGDLTGSSFAFKMDASVWSRDAGRGVDIRTVMAVTLYDVGPVTYPAYDGTTTGLAD